MVEAEEALHGTDVGDLLRHGVRELDRVPEGRFPWLPVFLTFASGGLAGGLLVWLVHTFLLSP